MTYSDWAESFTPVEIMHMILIREALWAHPERSFLISKLNNISMYWKRKYTKEDLLNQVSILLIHWCNKNRTSIKQMSVEAHKRYYIHANGWIERKQGLTPYKAPEPDYKALRSEQNHACTAG